MLLLLLGVLLLLLQSRRGQLLLLLLLLLVVLLLPRHVLGVEEHGCGRGGVVLRLRGRVARGGSRGLRDGLVGVAAGVGRAGRRRGQDVGGGRRGWAVGALALRREGPGGGGSGGGSSGGVTQI